MQCLTQCVLDLHWPLSIQTINKSINGIPCILLGASSCYFYFVTWNYTLGLSLEILLTIRNPFRAKSKLRNALYHSLCIGIPIPVLIVLLVDPRSDFNHDYYRHRDCYLDVSYDLAVGIWSLIAVHIPISLGMIVYSACKVWKGSASRPVIYHSLVVVAFMISWTPISIVEGVVYFRTAELPNWLFYIVRIIAFSSGFNTFCARLIEPSMRRQLLKSICICKKRRANLITTQGSFGDLSVFENLLETNFYSNFFEKLASNNIFNILYALTHLYRNKKPQADCVATSKDFTLWKFELFVEKKLQFRVKEYHACTFEKLRKIHKISNEDLINSLKLEENIKGLDERSKNPGGRGESFFYFTADRKCILKTLTFEEMELLKWMLPVYLNRLCTRNSFLAKILALYSIRINSGSSFYVMLMENILNESEDPLVFDLKGSSVDRQVTGECFGTQEEMPRGVVYKDTDFKNNVGTLKISKKEAEEIFKVVTEDTLMLQNFGIMDYSLLIGIDFEDTPFSTKSTIYYIGIIDYLQKYNSSKKLETTLKKFKGPGVSSVPPIPYRERFLKLVKDIFNIETKLHLSIS